MKSKNTISDKIKTDKKFTSQIEIISSLLKNKDVVIPQDLGKEGPWINLVKDIMGFSKDHKQGYQVLKETTKPTVTASFAFKEKKESIKILFEMWASNNFPSNDNMDKVIKKVLKNS